MNISAIRLNQRLKNGEMLNLLDVRDEIEFCTYNIGGSNIPLGQLLARVQDLEWHKNDEIIIICKIGLRSKTGKLILNKLGYTNVKNLDGGLMALQKLKYTN